MEKNSISWKFNTKSEINAVKKIWIDEKKKGKTLGEKLFRSNPPVHMNLEMFETAYCFTQIGLSSTWNQWIHSLARDSSKPIFFELLSGSVFFLSDASANSCRRSRLQLRPGPHQSSNPGKLKSLTNISNPHKFRRGVVVPVWIHPSLGIHFLLNYLFSFQFASMVRLAFMLIVPSGTCKPCQTQNRLARVWDRSRFARLRFEPNDSTICIGFSLLLKWRLVVVKIENIDFIACNMTGNKGQQSRKQKIVIHHFESASSSYDELFVIAFLFLTRWLRYFGKPSDIIHQ